MGSPDRYVAQDPSAGFRPGRRRAVGVPRQGAGRGEAGGGAVEELGAHHASGPPYDARRGDRGRHHRE